RALSARRGHRDGQARVQVRRENGAVVGLRRNNARRSKKTATISGHRKTNKKDGLTPLDATTRLPLIDEVEKVMKAIVLGTALFAATAAQAEVLTTSEARFFGYMIVMDAACGTTESVHDLAELLSKGARSGDFMAKKPDIVEGKELAKGTLAKEGKDTYCREHRRAPDSDDIKNAVMTREKAASLLGFISADDKLCGTHSYNSTLRGVKKSGVFYPGLLTDYAEEFAQGKSIALTGFKIDGETKYCRFQRNLEREQADFDKLVRALGVYEPPTYDQ
ncbi:MAG: hypothetical protein ACLPN5_18925, partial [Roseiarcus sp.]